MKLIIENWKKFANEEEQVEEGIDDGSSFVLDPKIQKSFGLSRRVWRSDRVRSEVARSSAYQKGHHPGYKVNNGNIVVVDSEGSIYYSPADANRADTTLLYKYLRDNNVPQRDYIVPTAFRTP